MSIDRRTILSATLAWAAATLSGCSDDSGGHGGGGASGGGTSGGGAGGSGPAYACATSMTGSHMHPLTIPGGDVELGYHDGPYLLENGGTGHTHNLEFTAYDFVYLQAGATIMRDSTTTNNHLHTCSITCTLG
jgi:hypothetical protein